ncbi:MAG: 4'-phosphopantetheinyl transferase family protein [Elainellaceae cyanobacterium]
MGIWRSPLECPPLLDREVHVWRSHFSPPVLSDATLRPYAQVLAVDEQERAQRFRSDLHRQQFIAARGLLRLLLGAYLEVDPTQIQFTYGPYGKPLLNASSPSQVLHFNLSHSHEMVLYAVTRDRPVGIDIEYLRRVPNVEQLAHRFFSPIEAAAISALPPDQQQTAFFCGWTRKEAYLKATGRGLADLSEVEVTLLPADPPRLVNHPGSISPDSLEVSDSLGLSEWTLHHLNPADRYVGALAVQQSRPRVQYLHWSASHDE